MKNILIFLTLVFISGCTLPLRPGRSSFKAPSGVVGSVQQSQNPQEPSTQIWERVQEPLSPGIPIRSTERVTTTIGAAQRDLGRETAAKLGSLKGVVWVGILVFLFGAASLFWPPLKLIVGSVTTSAAACAAGLALIILPSLLVGHELLILCVGVGAVGLYWFSHRHATARATVEHLSKK